MSAGLEIRGKSMRIWIKTKSTETPIKETLDWAHTPENIERAKKLADLIKLEIQLDQFDLGKHFPNSKHIKKIKSHTMQKFGKPWLLKKLLQLHTTIISVKLTSMSYHDGGKLTPKM